MIIFITSLLLLLILFLWLNSPGKLTPLRSKNRQAYVNGLADKVKLTIGGVEQGLFILSEDKRNPVLLFLHGGPGSPELPIIYSKDTVNRLEKDFTVCYWDQRGAGMSLKNVPESSMTLEQLIADTLEVTTYLKKRFKQDKIFLMGHSWGSYLGVKTIAQKPADFYAYIGMGQMSNQRLSEKLAHDYLINHARQLDDTRTLTRLTAVDPNELNFPSLNYIMGIRTSAMNKYGVGITHEKYSMMTILRQLICFKGYTLAEKLNYLRGSLFSLKHLFHYTIADDLNESTNQFEIPCYIVQGKYDYQVSYELAKQYSEKTQAPKKGFYTFENSAHSPIIEEREKFCQVLREIKEDTLSSKTT